MHRHAATALVLIALAALLPTGADAATPGVRCDFNGDGFGDVAVGVPNDNLGTRSNAGGVNVVYGTADGLRRGGAELWTRGNSVPRSGNPAENRFGSTLACGDFDGDGIADLAAASRDIAQEVTVVYGTTDNGLSAEGSQRWTDLPASALTAGDFDGNGADDLAVGYSEDDNGDVDPNGDPRDYGSVTVLYGASDDGLDNTTRERWTQASPGVDGEQEVDDKCGRVVEAGDFDGDGFEDLVWACAEYNGETNKPITQQLEGSVSGLRALHTQFMRGPGSSHAVGDFNGDGRDDLVTGHSERDGRSVIRYGVAGSGLVGGRTQLSFKGYTAAGDFNGDGYDDIAWGDPAKRRRKGVVTVAYGRRRGIDNDTAELWHPDRRGVRAVRRRGDLFGLTVASTDTDGDTRDDLIVGAPGKNVLVDSGRVSNAGAFHVLRGSAGGITARGDRFLNQAVRGIPGIPAPGDFMGAALPGS